MNTLFAISGLNDARRDRAFAAKDEAKDAEVFEDDEMEVLEPEEDVEDTDVIEVEEPVASIAVPSIDPKVGDWTGSKSSWDCV